MTILEAKAALDKKWTKLQKVPARDESKVTNKARGDTPSNIRRQESPLRHINGLVSFQKLWVREKVRKVQKWCWEVILRKTTQGTAMYLRRQGVSASHMMAVEVFDVISRLATCFGQTCDAVSGYTQVDYRKRTVQRFGSSYRNQEDHNIGTQLTIQ